MAFNPAVVGGAFALTGVVLQQAFTLLTERHRAKRDQARELQLQRIKFYTEMVTHARRIQRTLKESSQGGVGTKIAENRLPEDFNRLAESVAAVRLLASKPAFVAVERFEDAARRLAKGEPDERAHPEEHISLGPVVEALQEDLARKEPDGVMS